MRKVRKSLVILLPFGTITNGACWKRVPAGEPRRGARWQPRRRCLGSSFDGEVDPQIMQPAGSLQE